MEALGLKRTELATIQTINDEFDGTDEERFEHVLSELRALEKASGE